MLNVPPVRADFLGTEMMKRNVEGKFRVLSHNSPLLTVISQPGLHQLPVFLLAATPLDDHLVNNYIKTKPKIIKIAVFLFFLPILVIEALVRAPLTHQRATILKNLYLVCMTVHFLVLIRATLAIAVIAVLRQSFLPFFLANVAIVTTITYLVPCVLTAPK